MATRPKSSHVISKEQKAWIVDQLLDQISVTGVLARLDHVNRQRAAEGLPLWPRLSASGIRYYQKTLLSRITKEADIENTPRRQTGYLDPHRRLEMLRRAAEQLEVHIPYASERGEFTAARQWLDIVKEIDRQQANLGLKQGTSALDNALKALPIEALRALRDQKKA